MCQVSGCTFVVTATRKIGSKIRKGDRVLIDTDATPAKGCYVFHGVAVAVQRPL